jgi:hypothetical protein
VLVGVVFVVAVMAGAGGWWIGSRVKSPEQLATESAPPPPSLITAPVELRGLSEQIVVRGVLESPEDVAVNPGVPTTGEPVVTRVQTGVGDEVAEGAVLVEVSGRPVFILAGTVPAYRSLVPGLEGADVAQVQDALSRLGYYSGEIDGVFGRETQEAVALLYQEAGYQPAVTDDVAIMDAAKARVEGAERAVRDARAALDGAGSGSKTAVAQAEAELAAARRNVADAVAKAALNTTESDAAVATAQQEHDTLVGDPDATQAEINAAYLALVTAQGNAERIHLDDEAAVADARDRIEVAEVALGEAIAGPDMTGVANAVADARNELADSEADLSELAATSGVVIPSAEFVVVPSLPAQVTQLDLTLGAAPGSPAATLVTGSPVAQVLLTGPEKQLVEVGDPVMIESSSEDVSVEGQVASVAEASTTDSTGMSGFVTLIEPVIPLAADLAGSDIQVTITSVTSDEPVLVVPVTAVVARGDGASWVILVPPGGVPVDIAVEVGRSAGGFVEIRPKEGTVDPGDQVRIPTG